MRPIPRMTIVVPCDSIQTRKATLAVTETEGPVYLRFARDKSPVFTTEDTPFELGKAQTFREGKDVAIVACGILVHNALLAADELAKDGIECMVVNNHTVKPMDVEGVIDAAKTCGAVVTVEEHQIQGGMGSRVAEILSQHEPVPMEYIGVDDRFGESGDPLELIEHFGMGVSHIKDAVKRVLERK